MERKLKNSVFVPVIKKEDHILPFLPLVRKKAIEKLPVSHYREWIGYLKEEFQEYSSVMHRQERLKGEVVHFLLSFVGNLKDEPKEKVIQRALEEAKMMFSDFKEEKTYHALLENLLKQKAVEKFFHIEEGDVYTEKEVVTKTGQTKRIDRLIVKNKEVWVIDYKSSDEAEGGYKLQVEEYCSLLEDFYPGKKVKGYLLYLDRMACEQVYPPSPKGVPHTTKIIEKREHNTPTVS